MQISDETSKTQMLPPECMLRRARPEDMSSVRELVRSESLDPTQMRWEQFWVIACGGRVVACGQLRRFPSVQELGSLVVAPTWRGRGFGSVLVERLVQEATEPLYLECPAERESFYAGFGFVRAAWRHLPWPLKVKFGLSKIASALLNWSLIIMQYQER